MKAALLLAFAATGASAQLVPDSLIRAILTEFSAANAIEETRAIAARSRYPSSQALLDEADRVAARARQLGLENVRVQRFPSRAKELWDPVEGVLDMTQPEPQHIADLRDSPLLVAQGSAAGDITAELVDVGGGTLESGYTQDVRGKVLLASGDPSRVWKAMGGRGAAALISWNQLEFFGKRPPPFAVSWQQAPKGVVTLAISPEQAALLSARLRSGTPVTVHLHVKTREGGKAEIPQVMGEIRGRTEGQDVVLVAHLDHQKQGANDNASGAGVLLEAVAAVKRLIASGAIPQPERTLRFWWSKEIQSEQLYFEAHPEEAKKILLAVNLDQAGGDKSAENNLVAILSPDRLASWADDLVRNLAGHMSARYARAEHEPSPLAVAPGGSRQSFRAVFWPYAPLSDHIAFEAESVGIPAISLAVPSLHVIHSSEDTVDRLDPTWMKRSGLMLLASALFAANAGPAEAAQVLDEVFRNGAARIARAEDRAAALAVEKRRLDSVRALSPKLETRLQKERLEQLVKLLEP